MGYDAPATESSTAPVDAMLRKKFKQGKLSARGVQEEASIIAAVAGSSSASSGHATGIEAWAAAGAAGSHPGNASRDITLHMSKSSTNATVYSATIPFWDPVASKQIKDQAYF